MGHTVVLREVTTMKQVLAVTWITNTIAKFAMRNIIRCYSSRLAVELFRRVFASHPLEGLEQHTRCAFEI